MGGPRRYGIISSRSAFVRPARCGIGDAGVHSYAQWRICRSRMYAAYRLGAEKPVAAGGAGAGDEDNMVTCVERLAGLSF